MGVQLMQWQCKKVRDRASERERDRERERGQQNRGRGRGSKRMKEKEWKRESVCEPRRERVCARGSVGQCERHNASETVALGV